MTDPQNRSVSYLGPLTDHLAGLAGSPAILVAPSHAWGYGLIRQAALQGGSVAGLRVMLVQELIETLAEPGLAGLAEPLTGAAGPYLALRALQDAQDAKNPKTFKHLLSQTDSSLPKFPHLGESLFYLLDKLRHASMTPETLLKTAPKGSEEKFRELSGLLAAYQIRLAKDGWADAQRLRKMAEAQFKRADKLLGARHLLAPGAWIWDREEAEFLEALSEALAGLKGSVAWLEAPAKDLPSGLPPHLARLGKSLPVPQLQFQPLAFLFEPEQKKLPQDLTKRWRFLCSASPSAELRQGLRVTLADPGAKLDEVLALSADAATHESAARGMRAALDLPVSLGVSRPHLGLPAAEGIRAILEWASGGFRYSVLTQALRQFWLKAEHPFSLARAIEKLGLGFGVERLQNDALERLRQHYKDKGIEIEDAEFAALQAFGARLLEGLPANRGQVEVSSLAAWLRRTCESLTESKGEDEAVERASLLGALAGLERAARGAASLAWEDACELCLEALDSAKRGGQADLPGAWHLQALGTPPAPGRNRVLLCGLDEGVFPGTLQPDPFLSEEELKRLQLPTAEARVQERLSLALQCLCDLGAPESLSISWRSADLAEARAKSPSSLVLQLFRLKEGQEKDYHDLEQVAGDPAWPLPMDAIQAISMEEAEALLPSMLHLSPEAKQGWVALQARVSDKVTEHDGLQKIQGLDVLEQPWSASGLESMLSCARMAFYERFLKLDPAEEEEGQDEEWLDAAQRGNLLHEFYEWAMGEDPFPNKVGIEKKMGQLFARWMLELPPANPRLAKVQQDDLLREAGEFHGFLKQAFPDGWKVEGRELAFGMEGKDPAAFNKGALKGLKLRGKVDLVLKDGSKRSIWDYKTGGAKKFVEDIDKLLANGQIQIPAYMAALQILNGGASYADGGYLFPTRKGEYSKREYSISSTEALEKLETALAPALEALKQGDWRVGQEAECGYCDFKAACDFATATKKREQEAEHA